MDINIWQLGGGNGRNVVEYYRAMGVACIGPGHIEVEGCDWTDLKKKSSSNREASALWSFYHSVNPGDVILVKSSRKAFCMLGVVKEGDSGEKIYNLLSGRNEGWVDGWDLQHQIKIDWYDFIDEVQVNNLILKPSYHIPVIRFSGCEKGINNSFNEIIHIGKITEFLENSDLFSKVISTGDFNELGHNVPPQYCLTPEELRIFKSNNNYCYSETFRKIFFVIPFLQKIGWQPEFMELEKTVNSGRIDLVLYEDYSHSTPFCLIETKAGGSSLGSWAMNQVENYLCDLPNKEIVKILIATDGVRYFGKIVKDDVHNDEDITFEIDRYYGKMTSEEAISYLHPLTIPLDQLK